MTNDQGASGDDPKRAAKDPDAERRDVAATLLGSAEWREKLDVAREARAKVLAARTTDPERGLKDALAKVAARRRAPPTKTTPPPQASPPTPTPLPETPVTTPELGATAPPPLMPSMPSFADRPAPSLPPQPPRRRFAAGIVFGLLFGVLLGVGLGVGILAFLLREDPNVDAATWLRGVISEALSERSDLMPAAVDISPAPALRSQ